MPLKIHCKSVLLYALYALAVVLTNAFLPNVPLSIGLCFGMLICGSDLIATPLLYIAASAVSLNLITSALAVFEAAFLCAVTFLYRRTNHKIRWEAAAYLVVALLPFLFFSNWKGVEGLNYSPYLVRAITAVCIILYTFFAFKATYCAMYRLNHALPREDEILGLILVWTLCGAGLYRLAGGFVLFAVCCGLCVFAIRLARSPAAVAVCAVIGFAPALAQLTLQPITFFVIAGFIALLFCRAGRLAPSVIFLPLAALYAYYLGYFNVAVWQLVLLLIALFSLCFLPAIPADGTLKKWKDNLLVMPVLPKRSTTIMREQTSERLFKIADVFREIEQAFAALDEGIDEAGAKARLLSQLKERSCRLCDRRGKCEQTNVYGGFAKLVNAGCVKGKVNLIDLPSEITVNCAHPADLIDKLNQALAEYRRYMVESENAQAGRLLLAEQARGIANVMKNVAVELCKTPQDFEDLTLQLKKAFARHGISCSEVQFSDDENMQVTVVLCGDYKLKDIAGTLAEVCRKNFILKEKIPYDSLKTCYIFVYPPRFDAAFGMAYAIKKGESISGDTHSVIRINEHRFLMTLSDGMGSGPYAQKISATAISLIEAFYRAEMPRDTVLDTINKLLSYRRDERFTCLDIAAVDLNTGEAEFVKIGAPISLIFRGGNITVLEGEGLPLGILENVKPKVTHTQLNAGDIVIFMSDGMTSAFHSTPELCEYLQTLSPLNPQNLADVLLAEALNRTNKVAEDDMTVLCVRLFEPTA